MLRRSLPGLRFASWFGLAAVLGLWGLSPALRAAEEVSLPAASTASVDDVLRRGQDLEGQKRWGEALAHYEEALRSYPGESLLERRFDTAKIHLDVDRRYADRSFKQTVGTMTEQAALDLYAEVLLKIDAHYVELPGWSRLISRGTQSLRVALVEPSVLERYPALSPARVQSFLAELDSFLSGRLIQDRYAARDTVAQVARFAQKQIGLPPAAVILEYVAAAAGGLDDYSSFLTRDQLDEVYSQIEGNFVGLGIELKSNAGELLIVKVITGSPAQRAGLQGGDRIMAVDGRTTADLSTDGAADLLQGPEGSSVSVSILSAGQTAARLVSVRREHVDIPSVDEVKIADPAAGVAYIRINCFQKTTTRDVDAALWKLHRDGMRSLVLDLRGNPGGLLTAAVELVDKFVERGTIVSTRGRNRQEDFNYAAHKPGTWRVPLVVLIDGESASASEIFAGAIRDHRRGTIVGTKSYGKGSVQGIFPLNQAGAGVRLTTAMFYSPSGQRISKVGVSPDLEVRTVARPVADAAAAPATDTALDTAVQAARNQVAQRPTAGAVGQ